MQSSWRKNMDCINWRFKWNEETQLNLSNLPTSLGIKNITITINPIIRPIGLFTRDSMLNGSLICKLWDYKHYLLFRINYQIKSKGLDLVTSKYCSSTIGSKTSSLNDLLFSVRAAWTLPGCLALTSTRTWKQINCHYISFDN